MGFRCCRNFLYMMFLLEVSEVELKCWGLDMFSSIMNSFKRLNRSLREEQAALYFSTSPGLKLLEFFIRRLSWLYNERRFSIGISACDKFRIFACVSSSISPALGIGKLLAKLFKNCLPRQPTSQGTWKDRPSADAASKGSTCCPAVRSGGVGRKTMTSLLSKGLEWSSLSILSRFLNPKRSRRHGADLKEIQPSVTDCRKRSNQPGLGKDWRWRSITKLIQDIHQDISKL